MKNNIFATKEAQGMRKNEVALLLAVSAALIILIVLGFLGYLPHRKNEAGDVGHIKRVANLNALPPKYRVSTGENKTNARGVWVEEVAAPDNATKVLVTIIDRTDPSGRDIDTYYANHYGETCKLAKDRILHSHGREVHVKRSVCGSGEDTLEDAQAVFRISKLYAVSIYERSGPAQFNNPEFATVVNTALQSAVSEIDQE